ncbi:hypothetical protein ES711_07800 [Gelidibacter salicanalis]|uniref:Uncharacterized protein n=1 Tax=Gelidibacter salicanalis TaxID=291193 RepID=A0A5C7AKF3_9FLAO|nr:DUF6730 family protein [Gelidibacter salicanalis]TXE08404.1 hypothetical protein ES711_07800 [Gelidibacter salicanalis]
MTKLEEFTALLVNETTDFKNALEKLEKLNEQLKDTKIKMDVMEYKTIIENHQQYMASHLNSMERFQNHFDDKIKKAKIYPDWAVGVFIVSLVLSFSALVFITISFFI